MIHQTIAKLGQGIHFRGKNEHWSILTGALVAGSFIMGHLPTYLHVVCRFIGYWARRIHFWGQNKLSKNIYCQKSRIFSQKARACTFAHIPSKPKNVCNIHNSEFTCKKSASYDNSKLCLLFNHCLNFPESNAFCAPPPFLNFFLRTH